MTSSDEFTSFSHDQYYAKSFSVYRNKSTESLANIKSIESTLPDVLKRNSVTLQIPSIFKVLSVGCGNGSGGDLSICNIIKKILAVSSQKPTIFYQAVDPRADSLAVFRASANFWADENSEVESCFLWFTGTWQEYQTENKQDPQKFHLIHFIHSLYYLDIENTLRDCMANRLADDGLLFCVIADSDNPFVRFSQALNIIVGCHSSEAVKSIANKNGWRFDCFNFPYHMDVTEINDESSVEGNLLLDFFTHAKNYRTVADKSELEKVEKFWLDESQIDDNGKRKAFGQISAVIIYKS